MAKKKSEKIIKKEAEPIKRTRIRVVGIGGGGGNIVSEIASRIKKASFVVANTDLQALKTSHRNALRFQFGQNFTQGLGTGMNTELGELAAKNEKEKIKKLLEGQDFCLIVACLGGGTSSGAAPIFAKISKNLGNLTYGIFTLPFKFEGEKKMEMAKKALEKLKPKLNAITIIPNERIFQIIDKTTPLKEALSAINQSLTKSLEGLIETIYQPGLINIDFADLKTILEGWGRLAYLNTVEVEKKRSSAEELIKKVLHCPLYPYSIDGARGVLFNIVGEKNLELSEVNQISKNIFELVGRNKEAKIIFGISQSKKYQDTIKTTILATGCGTKIFSEKVKKQRLSKKSIRKILLAPPEQLLKEESLKKPSVARLSRATRKPKVLIRKSKPKKVEIKIFGPSEAKIETTSSSAKEAKPAASPISPQVEGKIRKNALQIKKESEAEEEEILKEEKKWETPAFLRKKNGVK